MRCPARFEARSHVYGARSFEQWTRLPIEAFPAPRYDECSMRAAIAILILAGLSQAAEWKQLFDGKSLDGWSLVGPGRFVVEDGMLKTEGGMGLLWYTGQPFANTTIRVVF